MALDKMTPQEKRKQTILKKYGSFSNMLKKRDTRDLILGGYNGGIAKTEKGFSKWEEGELKAELRQAFTEKYGERG